MIEIWKDVKGYEGRYVVSNIGRVKRLERVTVQKHLLQEKLIHIDVKRNGYCQVQLWKDGKDIQKLVHRLVAEAFIEKKEDCYFINHKDENKQNNCVNNLEWVSSKENANYGTRNVRISKTQQSNQKNSIPVYAIYEDGTDEWFVSGRAASRSLSISQSGLRNSISKGRPFKNIQFELAN